MCGTNDAKNNGEMKTHGDPKTIGKRKIDVAEILCEDSVVERDC